MKHKYVAVCLNCDTHFFCDSIKGVSCYHCGCIDLAFKDTNYIEVGR